MKESISEVLRSCAGPKVPSYMRAMVSTTSVRLPHVTLKEKISSNVRLIMEVYILFNSQIKLFLPEMICHNLL